MKTVALWGQSVDVRVKTVEVFIESVELSRESVELSGKSEAHALKPAESPFQPVADKLFSVTVGWSAEYDKVRPKEQENR